MNKNYLNKWSKRFSLVLVSFLLLLLTSCGKKDEPKPNPKPPVPPKEKLVEDLVVTDEKVDTEIVSVSEDKIVLNEVPPSVKVGGYIASDMTEEAPNGYLRKVVAVKKENGKVVLETKQAALDEVVLSGHYTYSHKFALSDFVLDPDDPTNAKISTFRAASIDGFGIKFKETVVIWDEDGNPKTKNDQLKASGSCTFNLSIDRIDLDFDNSEFAVAIKFENKNKITISAGVSVGKIDPSFRYKLASFKLPNFTILVGGFLPVPIAQQNLVFYLTASGEISAKVECGLDNKNSITAGFGYSKSRAKHFYPIQKCKSECTPLPFIFRGKLGAKAGINFSYELNPYGLKNNKLGIGLDFNLGLEATVNTSGNFNGNLSFNIDLVPFAQIKFFSRKAKREEAIWLLYSETLKSFSWNPNEDIFVQTLDVSLDKKTGIVRVGGTLPNEGLYPVLERGVVWANYNNPQMSDDWGLLNPSKRREKEKSKSNEKTFYVDIKDYPKDWRTIYVRAYIKTADGYTYGATKLLDLHTALVVDSGLPSVDVDKLLNGEKDDNTGEGYLPEVEGEDLLNNDNQNNKSDDKGYLPIVEGKELFNTK